MMEFASSWGFLFMMLAAGGGSALPLGVPPLPEDPVLAKVAPEQCVLYFSSAGMAKADVKSGNRTEQLCAEPELRHAVAEAEKLIRHYLKESSQHWSDKAKPLAEDGPTLVKVVLTRPLALYVSEIKLAPKAPPQVRAGAVINLGDGADKLKAVIERSLSALPVPGGLQDVTIGDTKFHRLPLPGGAPEIVAGVKGRYFYVAVGEGEMEALLKRADGGSAPKWLAALHKQMPVERVSTVAMLDVHAVNELLAPVIGEEVPRVLEALGVTGIERLGGVSGLDKDGFVSRSLVSLRGEPKGLLQLFEQKPLTAADLESVPRDATFAVALKLDPARARDTILDVIEKIDPKTKEKVVAALAGPHKELLDDVFKAVGDTWCVFDSPSEGGLFTGVTAVVSLKDADAAAAAEKKLMALAESAAGREADPRRRPRFEKFKFADHVVHVYDARQKGFPLAPSWCITDKQLIVALYPQAIKGYLARGKSFQPLTKVNEVAAALQGEGKAMALSYVNMQRLFDLGYPFLPVLFQMLASEMRLEGVEVPAGLLPSAHAIRRHLRPSVGVLRRTPAGLEAVSHSTIPGGLGLGTLPVAVGLLVPAVQKTREAAARMQSANNLKQMSLAIINMADTNGGTMPADAIYSKDGKPLLSWRVAILPYIEQDALYKEFHLDEPWDSEHNKKLLEKMPKVYMAPASAATGGKTHYRVFHGPGAAFEGAKGVRYPADFTDGTSNTIFIVEAEEAVPWTKPDELPFDAKKDLPKLGLMGNSYFLVALGDGSVRTVMRSITAGTLKAAITRNGGDVLGADW